MSDRTEALIFAASRAAHAAQLIRPALAEERSCSATATSDSSAACQGVSAISG